MRGLDTNVLIRHLTKDDPVQSEQASKVINAAQASELFISSVVLCEIIWVLDDRYGHGRDEIVQVVEKLLLTAEFVFENKQLTWQALADYRQGKGDLADHIIGHTARAAGCDHTLTFDRKLKRSELFRLL